MSIFLKFVPIFLNSRFFAGLVKMTHGFAVCDRQLAEAGARVVMAVRNTRSADELIKKWQNDWSGKSFALNIEVHT